MVFILVEEAVVVSIHASEGFAQRGEKLFLRDLAVAVLVHLARAIRTAEAAHEDLMRAAGARAAVTLASLATAATEGEDLSVTARTAGTTEHHYAGAAVTARAAVAGDNVNVVLAWATRAAHHHDAMTGAALAMTGSQFPGRQAAVVVRVEPVEGVAHRGRELLARHHAVAVRVQSTGAFAARADDADFGAGLAP